MGKIMFLWGNGKDGQDGYSPNGKQWALGGDTFVVGCQIPKEAVVFPEFNEVRQLTVHCIYLVGSPGAFTEPYLHFIQS